MARKVWDVLSEFIVLTVIAFVLAFGIRTAVAEVRLVPTGSMEPTIAIGDRLLTVKVPYYFTEPKRGDIVVFNVPKQVDLPPDSPPFIKRVVGIPGDTIEVKDGHIYVNGREYVVSSASSPKYAYGPVEVEDDMLFVLGDNRNESFDSHEWGFLPRKNVIAKAVVVIWPPGHMQTLK